MLLLLLFFCRAAEWLRFLSVTIEMGAACCGLTEGAHRRSSQRSKLVHSAAEPLLRENEREAVSSLLRYLEGGEFISFLEQFSQGNPQK